jgi:serine phosphatase RsbU (regulator of sigma subunit)
MNIASFAFEQWAAVVQTSPGGTTGDCARIVPRGDGRALFFVGDVAGHDQRAAAFAAELDSHVSHLARWAEPGELLQELNVAVEASWPCDVFVSALCFVLDPASGQGTIAAAGQVPPVIRGASSFRTVDVHAGPALGRLADQQYPERALLLEAGDVLVAVTDGITDPFATRSDVLGLGALARILDAGPVGPAAVCATVLSATRRIGLRDDATVLAIAPALRAAERSALDAAGEISLAA